MLVSAQPVQLILPVGAPRTPGVHLSSVIRCIATETGILKPEWEEDTSLIEPDSQSWWATLPPDAQARISMGLAWESWYIPSQLPDVIDHPGEMVMDGIYMTPDGEELTTLFIDCRQVHALKLHEVKCTYKSINTVLGKDWRRYVLGGETFDSNLSPLGPLTSQWMWMAQTKGYCYGAGTRFVDLHILFVSGDYSYPIRPVPLRCSIEFTQDEIDSNWELMTSYKLDREAAEGEA